MSKILTFVLLFTAIAFGPGAQAQMLCRRLYLGTGHSDTSIELELMLNERTAPLLTSEDGTLKTLFKYEISVPDEVRAYISRQSKDPLLSFPVDSLPVRLKTLALKQSIVSRQLEFGSSAHGGRIVPGIKVKDQYQKQYDMRKEIDLGQPKTTQDGNLIEMHLRSQAPSGELIDKANQIFQKIGYEPGSMHMHIVMPLMHQWLTEHPKMNTWRLVEFWRRLNLTFEMRDMIETGSSIPYKKDDEQGVVSFAPLEMDEIYSAFRYIYTLATKTTMTTDGPEIKPLNLLSPKEWDRNLEHDAEDLSLGSGAKMGWVGFWGHDKYDRADRMGFEFRFLTGKDKDPALKEFLSGFADQVQEHRFGLSEEDMQQWFLEALKAGANSQQSPALGKQYIKQMIKKPQLSEKLYEQLSPHETYENLSKDLPYDFKKLLLGMDQAKVKEAFESHGSLRYIIHDWSLDPILIKDPELIVKIRNAQLRALRRWAQGKSERQVVQEFLIDSGIYFHFAQSIGLAI